MLLHSASQTLALPEIICLELLVNGKNEWQLPLPFRVPLSGEDELQL